MSSQRLAETDAHPAILLVRLAVARVPFVHVEPPPVRASVVHPPAGAAP